MVDLGTIIEPVAIPTTIVDGLATIQVDRHGTARLVLYSEQLEADGSISPVISARLTMTHTTMIDIGQNMVTSFNGMSPSIRRSPRLAKMD